MKAMCGLSLALAAGCLTSGTAMGAETDKQVSIRTMKAWPVANIYYNVKTGERIAMPYNSAPRNVSGAKWINANTDPCGTGGTVGIIDNPDADGDTLGDIVFGGVPTVCTAAPTVPCEGSWNSWWGDLGADCVVDCVVLSYGIIAPDNDTDGDSIGDGIVGYDLAVTWSDNDPGFGADLPLASGRSCIFDLTLTTLPGALPGLPPGYVAVYTLTLDFASIAPSLVFELGDSDGIDDAGTGISGGVLYGFPTFGDRDGDTLNDFSYAYRFDQSALPVPGAGPGATKGANGFLTVAPIGCTANPCATPTDPPGTDGDGTDVYSVGPSCPPTITTYIGTFWFGGFSCATGAPHASSRMELYGPTDGCTEVPPDACSVADLAAPAGELNFDDVVAFLISFGAEGCASDLADPIGEWNFDDVVAFLIAFGAGCP